MGYPERYELVFQEPAVAREDHVIVRRTEYLGAGGHPVYMDETGIIRAEISDRGEIRMLASGGQQALRVPVRADPLGGAPTAPTAPTPPSPTARGRHR